MEQIKIETESLQEAADLLSVIYDKEPYSAFTNGRMCVYSDRIKAEINNENNVIIISANYSKEEIIEKFGIKQDYSEDVKEYESVRSKVEIGKESLKSLLEIYEQYIDNETDDEHTSFNEYVENEAECDPNFYSELFNEELDSDLSEYHKEAYNDFLKFHEKMYKKYLESDEESYRDYLYENNLI